MTALPPDVEVRDTPRPPVDDPTLNIDVPTADAGAAAPNGLVVIGDSVSHGVLSGAVWRTRLTWGAMLADVLGVDFRFPTYGGPGPGLPVNLETLVRMIDDRFGPELSLFEVVGAGLAVRGAMDAVEDYWERGPGARPPSTQGPILHNLAALGWDLRDALTITRDVITERLRQPDDQLIDQVPEQSALRAARAVFATAAADGRALTQLGAARALGAAGDPGIDTLVVMLGANNALRSVTELRVVWSDPDADDPDDKATFTISRPSDFARQWSEVVAELETIAARRVVVATVPHVTIAPIARGVGDKIRPGSRYFPYYTRPWISDEQFDPRRRRDPFITADDARAIDSAIDQYNQTITDSVAAAREAGRDWLLFDLASLLDRLAHRRFFRDFTARPEWYEPYPLPPELLALDPVPDTRFFAADASGRTQGGIFSLDGIHPTTIAQGLVAHEVLRLLRDVGAAPQDAAIDFAEVVAQDTLITSPPAVIGATLELFGWLDQTFDLLGRIGSFRG